MSGAGINPLLLYDPQDFLKLQQIQRRQALGQTLLESGLSDPGTRPYSGLVHAGNALLGAYLLKRGDESMASAFAPQSAPDPGQISNAAAPTASPTPSPSSSGPPQATPSPTPVGGTQAPQAAPPPAPTASTGNNLIDRVYGNSAFPRIPGVPPNIAVNALMQGGTTWENYFKQYLQYMTPTDEIKTLMQGGATDDQIRQFVLGKAAAGSLMNLRQGSTAFDPLTRRIVGSMPNTSGIVNVQGPDGTIGTQMAPGAYAAQAQAAAAGNIGKQATTPSPFVTPQGNYTPATAAQAAGLDVGQIGLGQPALPSGAMPAPPLGAGQGAGTQATAVVNRAQGYQQAANQTNLMNNILDNMNALVDRGLKPGMSEWQQEMIRFGPELDTLLGHHVDPNSPAVLSDIFNKFSSQFQLAQNAGIGASSTDALRATIGHANPNIEQFGPALKEIIPWLKSVNVGIRAQNNYLRSSGVNPAVNSDAYQQAENHFTNIYDPLMSQMAMQPNTPQGNIVRSQILSHVPADKRAAFLRHYKELIPYFRMGQ